MTYTLRSCVIGLAFVLAFAGCFDSDEPNKVELVDSTNKDPNQDKQAVSDEDFAALQEKVKTLETKLGALESKAATKTEVNTVSNSVSALNAEIAAVNSSLNAVVSSTAQQLWLYDGDGIRRHKLVGLHYRDKYQEAIVEIDNETRARYFINRYPPLVSSVYPESEITVIRYSGPDCEGQAAVFEISTGGDFGELGYVGAKAVRVQKNAVRQSSFSYQSVYTTNCANTSGTSSDGVYATTESVTPYTYPAPLTVGP